MILLQLYPVKEFKALHSSFAYSLKILKLNLIFPLRSMSNDQNASVTSVHPEHASRKDKQ